MSEQKKLSHLHNLDRELGKDWQKNVLTDANILESYFFLALKGEQTKCEIWKVYFVIKHYRSKLETSFVYT